MRKFIVKFVLFCVILVGIFTLINARYISVKNTKDTDKFKDIPNQIQICNFGSSHGENDYHYDNWADKYICFNFAMPSQSLDYDWRIMQCFQDNISEDALVFITISYFSFYGIDETLTDNFLSKNKRYYRFLPKEYIKDYDFKTDILENDFPSTTAYENLFMDLVWGPGDSDDTDNTDAGRYLEAASKRHLVNEKLDENGNRIVNQEYMDSLYNMIELCKKKGATPVLITTPYLAEYPDIVNEKAPYFFDEFYSTIGQVVEDTGVEYFDYSRDDRFRNEEQLFINADHLNHDGALKFVDILMEEIVEKVHSRMIEEDIRL